MTILVPLYDPQAMCELATYRDQTIPRQFLFIHRSTPLIPWNTVYSNPLVRRSSIRPLMKGCLHKANPAAGV